VLVLSVLVSLEVSGPIATAKITLRAGHTAAFALHHARALEPPPLWCQAEIAERLADTIGGWRSWSRLHQAYEDRGRTWRTTPTGCRSAWW
jgi:alpha,alpha-trehalase